jgi:integrase/recombinase XerD
MNDIFRLKYANIDSGFIIFRRQKTKNTDRNSKPIEIPILKKPQEIIDKWGNEKKKGNYIFPLLNDKLEEEDKKKKIKQATKTTNSHVENIANELKIKTKITTYSARHSFASILKQSGQSIAFISEQLGHTSLATTESYLASFEKDKKKEAQESLMDF